MLRITTHPTDHVSRREDVGSENPISGLAARLLARPSAGPREIQSDSYFLR